MDTVTRELAMADLAANVAEVTRLSARQWGYQLVWEVLSEVPSITAPGLAHRTSISAGVEHVPAERGLQTAVYEALARVPPLVVDEGRPPVVETIREVEKKNLPPMKLPRGKFRRIVVRGRAYGWMARIGPDSWLEVPVRDRGAVGGQHGAAAAGAARPAGGAARPRGAGHRRCARRRWTPTVNDPTDFAWDGTPYLT